MIVIKLVRVRKHEHMLLRLICLAVQKKNLIIVAVTGLLHRYCTGKTTELLIQTSRKKECIPMFFFKKTVKDYGYLRFMERKKVKYWRTRFADQ